MNQRIYHGNITAKDISQALNAEFNRGNLRAQEFRSDKKIIIQIATQEWLRSGGHTALSVVIIPVEDGVSIQLGNQNWVGLVASLGQTAISTLLNPWNLLGRLDDLAQDYESLNLSDQIWEVIESTARTQGASHELSERLRRVMCSYCQTANPVGESSCIACGAPLGMVQPQTCPKCGYAVRQGEIKCPNCGNNLVAKGSAGS